MLYNSSVTQKCGNNKNASYIKTQILIKEKQQIIRLK